MRLSILPATLLLAAVAAGCWMPVAWSSEIDYARLTSTHLDQIDDVRVCGTWDDNASEGRFRIVHAVVYAQSVIFVQWLSAPDPDTGLVSIKATYSPSRINDDHADVALTDIRCMAQSDGITVRAGAYSGHEGRAGTMLITAKAEPGKASIRIAYETEAAPAAR